MGKTRSREDKVSYTIGVPFKMNFWNGHGRDRTGTFNHKSFHKVYMIHFSCDVALLGSEPNPGGISMNGRAPGRLVIV